MFANLKISLKLAALIALLLLAMVTVGAFAGYALLGAQSRSSENLQQARQLLRAVDVARESEVSYKIQIQEFKNVLLRGHDQKDYDNYLASFTKRGELVRSQLTNVKERMTKLGIPTSTVDEAIAMQSEISRTYLDGLKQFDVARPETTQVVDKIVRGKDRPLEMKIQAVVDALQKHSEQEVTRVGEASTAESSRVLGVFAVFISLAVLASIVGGALVSRSITRPIGAAVSAARRVADGDLTVDIQTGSRDETGQLLQALAEMTQNLRNLVGEVADGAHTVSDTSAQIAQGNVDLSQRTEEQASTLEETASSLEELTSTVTQNAHNARQASQLAVGASEVARKGGQVVGQVVATMSGISESSRKIADIISVIDGIAFQTNILA
ncbi:MAG: HAMP domain-containing protein, partial [Rhodoferax sp.]|nr:HAMP domain-containing protein [Rhodoferax sp.]